MKIGLFALSLAAATIVLAASSAFAFTIAGHVVNDSGAALSAVTVSLPAVRRMATTDDSGLYRIENVPHGVYTLEFSLIGYSKATTTLHLDESMAAPSVVLHTEALQGDAVIVTGSPQPSSILDAVQPTRQMSGRELERERGSNVMDAVAATPGVTLYTTGASLAKPVIRGLTSQRVLVLADGVRQEGQQWGDEHAPEFDALNTDRMEVVRGPASVLYGSDAVGGVVNVIPKEIPSADEGAARLSGEVTAEGFSNGKGGAGAIALEGASGKLGYRGYVSGRASGNTATPHGDLFNSSFDQLNGSGSIGTTGPKGAAVVEYSHFGTRLEIHEDPAEDPTATPFQRVEHDRVHLHGLLPWTHARLEANVGWQRNNRREFEEEDATLPELDLLLNTSTAEVKLHHHPGKIWSGTLGASFMGQNNTSRAEEKLIPDFTMNDYAGYIYEEATLSDVILSGGVRGEWRNLDVDESVDLGVPAQTRDYSSLTASGGLLWKPVTDGAVALSVGRAWRAPTPFELFVNGVHEGTIRYEVGDSTLEPEVALNLEADLRYNGTRAEGELSLFRNAIDRYIYQDPTGQIDSASGFGIYLNRQANATLQGFEASGQVRATNSLTVNGGVDYVRGTNEETNQPLPLIPAYRVKAGARLSPSGWGSVKAPYVSFDVRYVAKQTRVDPAEQPSEDYTLIDLGAGIEMPTSAGRVRLDLKVENAFDTAYRDHLSRYKDYADNPGRNVWLKLAMPFTMVH